MSQLVYCRNCGTPILTGFDAAEFYGEVCGRNCFNDLCNKLEIEKLPTRDFLSIAELDPVLELDVPLSNLLRNTDIVLDRWIIPSNIEYYFRGPDPNGWPKEIRLEFPIATFRNAQKEQRVFGLESVLLLIEDLIKPCFKSTRVVPRSRLAHLQTNKQS